MYILWPPCLPLFFSNNADSSIIVEDFFLSSFCLSSSSKTNSELLCFIIPASFLLLLLLLLLLFDISTKFEPLFPLDEDFKVVTNRFLFDVVMVAGEEARKDDFNLFLAGLVIAFKEIDLVKI